MAAAGAPLAAGATPMAWPRSAKDLRSAISASHRILGVHGLDVERLGVLRIMRVCSAAVDLEVRHLLTLERTARHHALDGELQHALGELALEDLAGIALL